MTDDLIDYNCLINFVYFVIENIIFKTIIGLNVEISAIKIVIILVLETFKIDVNSMYKEIVLI